MNLETLPNAVQMGKRAAEIGGNAILAAIETRGAANIVVATGASQFEVLQSLVARQDIDWSRVTGFHLDEYIGLPAAHPASFRKYLQDRFVDRVPLAAFHYVNGDAADAQAECGRLREIIRAHPIDVMFCGIGENAHLAFNDPPADFQTDEPYIIVELDEACRKQQLGEGWFPTLEDVPQRAISMSIRQIVLSGQIVCSVPDERKSAAVQATVEGEVSPDVPASILQQHKNVHLLLDEAAASRLKA